MIFYKKYVIINYKVKKEKKKKGVDIIELSSFEVKNASAEDLKAMISMCEQELKIRNATRRDELIQAICNIMNLLHKEFPTVELRMGYQCPECAMDDEVDMMEYFCGERKMNPKDFYI